MKYWVVNAFKSDKGSGNPAGVIMLPSYPSDADLQRIASYINHSETAFVVKISNDHFFIRWFTPKEEAPLCGHATIAALKVMALNGIIADSQKINFSTIKRDISATYHQNINGNEIFTLQFPKFSIHEYDDLPSILGLVRIGEQHPKSEKIYRSENCFILELENCEEVSSARVNLQDLAKIDCRALILTALNTENSYGFRYFAPRVGINEDPVCASAQCRLIPFWSKKLERDELTAIALSVEGGEIQCTNEENHVLIAGQASLISQQELPEDLVSAIEIENKEKIDVA